MGHYTKSQLITRDKLNNIPNEIIHFSDNGYTHFPLNIYFDREDIINEFGKYETTDDLIDNKKELSSTFLEIINLIERLEINSFLVEFLVDVGDWYPPLEFIQFIVNNRKIVKESIISNVDEEGILYAETILQYDYNYKDDFFTSYENAKKIYFKIAEK